MGGEERVCVFFFFGQGKGFVFGIILMEDGRGCCVGINRGNVGREALVVFQSQYMLQREGA